MTLATAQKSTYKGNNLWAWSVHLTGTDAELDQVDHVVYHLHPTFREPVRKATDRATSFEMSAVGWGTFQIQIEVAHKDGSTVELIHELELYHPESEEEAEAKSRTAAERGALADPRSPAPRGMYGSGHGKEKPREGPRVFLSSSASANEGLDELRKDLELQGIEVVGEDDLDPSRPLRLQINELKDESDAVIGVVSGRRMSRVVSNDLNDAVRVGKPVMIINTGDENSSKISDYLQWGNLKSSQILSGKDSKKLAGQINSNIRKNWVL